MMRSCQIYDVHDGQDLSGDTYLGNHLRANDYYSRANVSLVNGWGAGAEKLGLNGEVTPEQFEALRTNQILNGRKTDAQNQDTREASTREAEIDFRKKNHHVGTDTEVEAHRLKWDNWPTGSLSLISSALPTSPFPSWACSG